MGGFLGRRHAVWGRSGSRCGPPAAEDLPDASYAGLYETYGTSLLKGWAGGAAVFAATTSERVSVVSPAARWRHGRDGGPGAGDGGPDGGRVAFTAHPVTGDRDQVLVTAVPGFGDPLVSGEAVGE